MDTLTELLEEELKDIYSAETQLTKFMPRLVKKISSPTLKEAFEVHIEETLNQIERLNQVAGLLEIKLTGKVCAAMKGLIEEGKELLTEKGDPSVLDAALIGAAQRIEHYEIAAYGTVATIAKQLGLKEVSTILGQTLAEEKKTDVLLSKISVSEVLKNAPAEEEEEE
ncbi:MAG TPA: ferritin-like domain-containing protein [Tepidisphaeraceae bacterium]|jgi:ferritin-like metal-binding protein YciE